MRIAPAIRTAFLPFAALIGPVHNVRQIIVSVRLARNSTVNAGSPPPPSPLPPPTLAPPIPFLFPGTCPRRAEETYLHWWNLPFCPPELSHALAQQLFFVNLHVALQRWKKKIANGHMRERGKKRSAGGRKKTAYWAPGISAATSSAFSAVQSRAGHLRFFLFFSIIKNDLLHFYQVKLTGSGLFK